MESVPGDSGNPKIERILSDILVKLDRIEEKIDEAVYPPESAIRPAYVKKIKEAESGLSKEQGKTYFSMDDSSSEKQQKRYPLRSGMPIRKLHGGTWQE